MDDPTALAESRVVAFTKCELIKINYEAVTKVLAYYPEDKKKLAANMRKLKDIHGISM